jgi:hypothetical protein
MDAQVEEKLKKAREAAETRMAEVYGDRHGAINKS